VPLSLAVGFAMVASYLLSSTFVPVLAVWLLKRHPHAAAATPGLFSFERFKQVYAWFVRAVVLRARWVLIPTYLVASVVVVVVIGSERGTEIFPNVDSGQFQLRVK